MCFILNNYNAASIEKGRSAYFSRKLYFCKIFKPFISTFTLSSEFILNYNQIGYGKEKSHSRNYGRMGRR